MIRVGSAAFLTALVTSSALRAQTEATVVTTPAGRLTESPLSATNLLETAGGLVLVLALIMALAWLFRRMGRLPGAGKGVVQIVGGVSLGPRERAVVLAVDGVRLLVGVAPGRVQTLHVLGPELAREASEDVEQVVTFSERLEQAAHTGRGG
jgi:flagellar protein FliO/FliZ